MNAIKRQESHHAFTEDDIEIKLSHTKHEESLYITELDVGILVNNQPAGKIDAVLIDRESIPCGDFFVEMDEYSADTQWLSVALFEPKYGRTKLKSLSEYDDTEFPILYIKSFTIHPQYREDNSSDVGSFALKKLFHHEYIHHNLVPFAIYVLDGIEVMSKEEKKKYMEYRTKFIGREMTQGEKDEENMWMERLHELNRIDANQFLRNGFYQDEAYAKAGGAETKILVAANCHWTQPLKSHNEATSVEFYVAQSGDAEPQGVNSELLQFIESNYDPNNVASSNLSVEQKESQIRLFLSKGASVAGSNILHAAVMYDSLELVKHLVGIEPSAINDFDEKGCTPLMVAAIICAGRASSSSGENKNIQVLSYLLSNGAYQNVCDSSGMTAYGKYLSVKKAYKISMQTLMGGPVLSSSFDSPSNPDESHIMRVLLPYGGPTESDLRGGESNSGFIDFDSDEDDY